MTCRCFLCYQCGMSIAAYIRVSSKDQRHDGQREAICAWLSAHGHDLQAVEWFEDTDTGAHFTRTGLTALHESIFTGRVKTIVVWKLDRIGRSLKDGMTTLSGWCESGVRVVSVTQQIDLSGTIGQTIAAVLFGMAEIELQHIKERQAAGIAAAKARGVYKGRKRGTTKGTPKRAYELYQQGLKPKEIALAMQTSTRTIQRYLKDYTP